MGNKIIDRHISWISRGYRFEDIQTIRQEILDANPDASVGTREMQYLIAGEDAPTAYPESQLGRLTFLWVEDHDFNGDLSFLEKTRNIENISISGKFSNEKISDLRPLEHLGNLNRIHLDHHRIKDLSPLSKLGKLQEINLYKNRLDSITPISRHTNIELAKFSGIREEEILGLLRHSNRAIVSFSSPGDSYSYEAFWINDWAFKAAFIKQGNLISTKIDPIKAGDGPLPLMTEPRNLRGIILKSRQLAASLLSGHEEINDSDFTYVEKSNVLNGRFQFSSAPSLVARSSRN